MVGFCSRKNDVITQWSSLFKHCNNQIYKERNLHWKKMLQLGLPTREQAIWKYTPLDQLFDNQFVFPISSRLDAHIIEKEAFTIDAVRLVFIDGWFISELSDNEHDAFSIKISQEFEQREDFSPIKSDFFLHLTESLARQVTFIHLASGIVAKRPLYLLHISSSSSNNTLYTSHYRHHFQQDDRSEATIIEHYISLDESPHFTGSRLTVSMGNNSKLIHYNFSFEDRHSYHTSHNDLKIGSKVDVQSHSFLLGAGLTRHQTSVQLNGERSNLIMNSLMIPIDKEVCESRSFLEHHKGYCKSDQLHKTIVCDCARAVFNGIMHVLKDASKTEGYITNRNMLLGSFAEVNTEPKLEIYHDDVQCGHGTTTGSIDKEKVFYLQSRGIDISVANRIIMYAFISELTRMVTNDVLKEALIHRITKRFSGGLL
ncbi:Fe-S cluster assembly protein SufD [Candidatus Erwinia haradaeae]|uniref:FeS cluster assembly protein SufD n=1 Tax=Candidatus Erwinia haradaeae TaxID=1922217 RepID=A0A803GCT8_9GAMM|nr:Fe-S cluster assembly protein SufD [Candidatus Erwinia haradaeae]VFP88600.1 FeS cluster assembly protein SufD [Candidatus Erwinia haradaeae]